ncbi:hypothetical protein CRYUN_Cryun16bG0028900 [Craigia yunnanensis]
MLASSILIGDVNENAVPIIGYPTMSRNIRGPCKGGNCMPPASNLANRGCERFMRCRHE